MLNFQHPWSLSPTASAKSADAACNLVQGDEVQYSDDGVSYFFTGIPNLSV